ncbi:MAG: hypothetical protein HQK65_06635 [Desulfamplus sp.]|nr:hypothetical protein [Desulfamplus sp.]
MIFREGELEFDFSDAIHGFKFDETDKQSIYYHDLSHCMKAVDFIVELENDYLFVEVKDFNAPEQYDQPEQFRNLRNALKDKFRDTFLYRFAEIKVDKPIRYLCLMTLEDALISRLMKEMRRVIPEGMASARWKTAVAKSCVVANINRWNHRFPKWPVCRIKSGEATS